ncbi:PrgI family protein [Bifidobacterium pseudolongum]|uniref:PrgI family protein n=1 Tax=Bifidobacterium pseudolongum TaxID=1694 RepID=A0A4S4F613_9BIFI|nr:PrgI family protein [Bifidobacterium pseudolongum]THG24544.1 PrgI family protein [Bifidobacterium pseudolongum]
MALQMPVYLELTTIEPKVFFGLSWRKLAAVAAMVILGGGVFVALVFGAHWTTSLAMYAVAPVVLPFALFGFWRPKGLMPEKYLKYVVAHLTSPAVLFLDGPAHVTATPSKPSIKER